MFHLQIRIEKVVHVNAPLNVLLSSKKLPSITNKMGRTSPGSETLTAALNPPDYHPAPSWEVEDVICKQQKYHVT